VVTAGVVFACVFAGALLGLFLRSVLPHEHRSTESKDVVKLAMGLLVTMAALVLGLLVASAKSSYDAQTSGVVRLAANVAYLDRIFAHYGPEAKDARDTLRRALLIVLDRMSPRDLESGQVDPAGVGSDGVYEKIQALSPQTEAQRTLRAEAVRTVTELARTRALLFAQRGSSIPHVFLVVLIFWVAALFVSFGLFAPTNTTVVVTLVVCALSVAGAIFLILELDQPFEGLIKISDAPLRAALAGLGR
jgi:hypothetical protein